MKSAIILVVFGSILVTCFARSQDASLEKIRKTLLERAVGGWGSEEGEIETRMGRKSIGVTSGRSTDTADLTIDLRTIDTSQFSGMYSLWSEVRLRRRERSPIIDADHDGRKELYGGFHDYTTPDPPPSRIYEFDGFSLFHTVYQFADTLYGPMDAADIDGDSLVDVVYYDWPTFKVKTQANQQSLPIVTKFSYYFGGETPGGKAYLYDMNSDGFPELVYRSFGDSSGTHPCPNGSNYIERYDSASNSFRVVYCNRLYPNTEGFAFGDFDMDGKQNFSNGGINGELFIYEHQGADSFSVMLVDTVATDNAFLSAFSNDLDSNGRPELWIGGDMFDSGGAVTRLLVYEASGDDAYQCVYRIDILGVFSFFAGNIEIADFDNDGKNEVVVCIDQHVLVLKNTGPGSYGLWYMRTNELADAGLNSVIYNASVADFDNDGYPEILVGMDQVNTADQIRYFTRIYKYNGSTGVGSDNQTLPSAYKLKQNYPNPFNSETIIRYQIPRSSMVSMKVYDVLGREVRQLQNTRQEAGEYDVWWDGRDRQGRELPSGVYFVRLQANEYIATAKAMILR